MPDTMNRAYEVTADGRVYSLDSINRWRGKREIAQHPNSWGYPSVRLVIGGKRKRSAVHTLVAESFLPPKPSPLHQIRHLNGDKTDNRASNLAWGTAKDNADDREAHGRTARGQRHGRAVRTRSFPTGESCYQSKLTAADVLGIRRMDAPNLRALSRHYGVSFNTIWNVWHRKTWRHVA
jgi:hypothetical protein